MALTSTDASPLIEQEVSDRFLKEAVERDSIAAQVTTLVTSGSDEISFPRISGTSEAAFVGEGEAFSDFDVSFDDITVKPQKLGAISSITNEALADATVGGGLASVIMDQLTGKLTRGIDRVLFATDSGLPNVDGVTTVNAGTEFTNADAFVEATYGAQARGTEITAFVASAQDALALGKLKAADGSNQPLLMPSSIEGKTVTTIAGVPLLVSEYVPAGTVYGMPASRIYLVMRQGASIETSEHSGFASDRTLIRGKMRIGFGFVDEPSIQKIQLDGADNGAAEGN